MEVLILHNGAWGTREQGLLEVVLKAIRETDPDDWCMVRTANYNNAMMRGKNVDWVVTIGIPEDYRLKAVIAPMLTARDRVGYTLHF